MQVPKRRRTTALNDSQDRLPNPFSRLREARQRSGLTLEDISEGLGIRTEVLEQVEQQGWGSGLGEGYLRSVVAQYAEHLGLNAAALVAMVSATKESGTTESAVRTEPVGSEPPTPGPAGPESVAPGQAGSEPTAVGGESSASDETAEGARIWLVALLMFVVAVAALAVGFILALLVG